MHSGSKGYQKTGLYKFIKNSSKKISLFTNFEISQKLSVKSQIFLHIYLVPIMYEPWKLKKDTGNKNLFQVILEWCVVLNEITLELL